MSASPVCLITGASRGIGRAAALAFAKAGYHVIAVARTQGALEELDDAIQAQGNEPATLVPLDLKDFDAIDRLGAALFERYGKLDVLIGNAAILGPIGPLGHMEQKLWDNVMNLNVTANWRLLRSMDPLLQAAQSARAFFLTSSAAHQAQAYWGFYAASKAALEVMVRTYAAETATTPVKTLLINPGRLNTAMRRQAMPGEDASTLKTPEDFAPKLVELATQENLPSGLIYDFKHNGFLKPQTPVLINTSA